MRRIFLPVAAVATLVLAAAAAGRADDASADDSAALAALMTAGETVYAETCRACHGASGGGYIGPSLAGNTALRDPAHVFHQISRGGDEMPALLGTLTREQILAVDTYVRNAWGNDFGMLTEANATRQ